MIIKKMILTIKQFNMLNITDNRIHTNINLEQFPALAKVEKKKSGKVLLRLTIFFFITALICMFLPWTQNVTSKGNINTLRPDQRPQSINSILPGRIEKWFVQEGDQVKKGDTILFLSEIKDNYFDPDLLSRTQSQIKAKELSVSSYIEKVKALDNQIGGLAVRRKLERQQLLNKLIQAQLLVTSDSIELEAAALKYSTASTQYDRIKKMYAEGLKSLTDMENRELVLQNSLSAKIAKENKLLASKNKVINAKIELNSIDTKYQNDISKAESDKYTALSAMYDAEGTVTKMQNQYSNYSIRSGLYYITAPQDGYVTRVIQSGIGETIKPGAEILTIMPVSYDLIIEMYIDPIDLPLIQTGQVVRIQFEGWPAIVFSGWPNTSYGTYGGKVYAIDNFISSNGKYRVLVAPDENEAPWPKALRVGSNTSNILLLKDVPVWYELWRKINDFPPDFYNGSQNEQKAKQ